MPNRARFCGFALPWLLVLCVTGAYAQSTGSRSLAEEMDSSNTATQRMLDMVKAAKAQEQAAKGFGKSTPLPASNPSKVPGKANASKTGSRQNSQADAPESPTLWFLAGVGDKLVAELVYQQRVYKANTDSLPQTIGPWTLVSIDSQGLSLSHKGGKTVSLRAPQPGAAPPQLQSAPALTATAVPAILPTSAPAGTPAPSIFPLPR